jgi:ABC-type antimicrobial peptide transport system permease subunit
LLTGVLTEGALMAVVGIAAGALSGYALTQLATAYFAEVQVPGALPAIAAAVVLLLAAVIASVLPAARAARTDVMQALRSE